MPTVAPLAMLVDHIGGLVHHHRRDEVPDDRPLNTASLRENFLRQF
jgi:hypothetical protein